MAKARAHPSSLALIAIIGAAVLWQGCTATKDNYALLSTFFDGVPDPNAKLATIDQRTGEIRATGSFSAHKPYAEERCGECHQGAEMLTRDSSAMCLRCHEGVPTQYPRMHGPVAAVACLWCHHPHESVRPHLMREEDRKLCTQCHVPGGFDPVRVPAHADERRACMECHTAHGGTAAHMLRPGADANTPPPRPSVEPERRAPSGGSGNGPAKPAGDGASGPVGGSAGPMSGSTGVDSGGTTKGGL
jgi:predicted CXXCH cytochrome family protein